MTMPAADDRAIMIDTIARFLDAAAGPARGWTTSRDGAERLAALLLDAVPAAGGLPMSGIGPLAPTRSLRQLRQQEARPLLADPLPQWAACADDHCRTVRHCVHGQADGRSAPAARQAEHVPAPRLAVTAGTVEPTPAG